MYCQPTTMSVVTGILLLSCICGIVFGYELTVLHNNDVHAHFEEINKYSGECTDEQEANGACFGGEARRVTVIKEARQRYANTLVLDAGDRFTGTLWFIQYKGAAAAHFVNKENYDAMCLGNHEFDLGIDGLVPFLDNLTVPVVDANIDVSREPRLQNKFQNSIVKTVGGEKIGIIGFITRDTAFISNAGPTVTFTNITTAVIAEVAKLRAQGVKIIFGLSHAGYVVDQQVALAVDGIDVIVGGHSHTFLYDGPKPSTEAIEGPYPTVVTQSSGRKVLVVQAYAWGKYMGFLNVTFDDDFEVQSWSGEPILLDSSTKQDPDTLADIERMKQPLKKIKSKIVGRTVVALEGDPIQCRLRECNTGNMLADAMIMYHVDMKETNDTWALSSIALLNSGGIRASTEPGNISNGQVLTVQPFGTPIDLIRIKGQYIRAAFEHSVANYNPQDRPGAFLQVSGVRVKYDLDRTPGNRVISLDMRCLECTVPTYSPLDDNETYSMLLGSFVIKGGDGYDMIKNNIIKRVALNSLDADILRRYLQTHNPVFAEAEGRIQFVNSTVPDTPVCPVIPDCPTATTAPTATSTPTTPPTQNPEANTCDSPPLYRHLQAISSVIMLFVLRLL